jgi:hypothetical protein
MCISFFYNQNDYLINKNVQIFYGEYEEIIPEFTNNQYISFIYINEFLYTPVKSVLYSIFNKINKNTIIVFDKFINYTNENYNALKSFYELYDKSQPNDINEVLSNLEGNSLLYSYNSPYVSGFLNFQPINNMYLHSGSIGNYNSLSCDGSQTVIKKYQ